MGKSINSWNSYVGHVEKYGKNDAPEKRLFVAVLSQAAHDCFSSHVERKDRDEAKNFFQSNTWHFKIICELADRNPLYVRDKMTEHFLNNSTITNINQLKTYRRDNKTYKRKKHLTGNAYYAAKRKREEEHV